MHLKYYYIYFHFTAPKCETCHAKLMFSNPNDTIGYFDYIKEEGVHCTNLDAVYNLQECTGYCDSVTLYSELMLGFVNDCHCCKPTSTNTKTVTLHCNDGTTVEKEYDIPTNCGCGQCIEIKNGHSKRR